MKNFVNDFKAFIMRGNIVDMAVGVVVGGAFGKIVTSLVNDIITPLISLATGKVSLADLKAVLRPEVLDEAGEVAVAELAIKYGSFLQNIIDFLIIALSIFFVIRVMMNVQKKLEELKKKEEVAEEETPAEPVETELSVLMEIRDKLAEK
ncbi:MAG: large-conductance mechanosensitive channel protein MscL [Clostridia bacterium]|nr:large-conductance mechanosensitive channel protein MscL [Clostridia bacterium]